MKFVIEFRTGTYWDPGTEVSGACVPLESAWKFSSRHEAEEKARQWRIEGAKVVTILMR